MADSLDRAVDTDIDFFRPATVPPFEVIERLKRRRDRRRAGAAAAALSAAAVAGGALVIPTPNGSTDRLQAPSPAPTLATDTALARPHDCPGGPTSLYDPVPFLMVGDQVYLQQGGVHDAARLGPRLLTGCVQHGQRSPRARL